MLALAAAVFCQNPGSWRHCSDSYKCHYPGTCICAWDQWKVCTHYCIVVPGATVSNEVIFSDIDFWGLYLILGSQSRVTPVLSVLWHWLYPLSFASVSVLLRCTLLCLVFYFLSLYVCFPVQFHWPVNFEKWCWCIFLVIEKCFVFKGFFMRMLMKPAFDISIGTRFATSGVFFIFSRELRFLIDVLNVDMSPNRC